MTTKIGNRGETFTRPSLASIRSSLERHTLGSEGYPLTQVLTDCFAMMGYIEALERELERVKEKRK